MRCTFTNHAGKQPIYIQAYIYLDNLNISIYVCKKKFNINILEPRRQQEDAVKMTKYKMADFMTETTCGYMNDMCSPMDFSA